MADSVNEPANKIIANMPKQLNQGSLSMIRQAKTKSQQIINTNTAGTGKLSKGMQTIIKKTKNNSRRYSLGFTPELQKEAKAVHDSFQPHFVHRDMIKEWLALHPEVKLIKGIWLEVGFPKSTTRKDGSPKNTAPWITQGGLKFFNKAFQEVLKLSKKEFDRRITNLIKK